MKRDIWMGIVGLALGVAASWSAAFSRGSGPGQTAAATAAAAVASIDTAAPTAAAPAASSGAAAVAESSAHWLRRWCETGANPEQSGDAQRAVVAWAETDPAAALDFVWSAPRFPGRRDAVVAALRPLAARDLGVAVDWLHDRVPDDERPGLAAEVVTRLARANDPRRGLALLAAFPGAASRQTYSAVIRPLARLAPAEGTALFARLTDDERSFVADDLVAGWAETDFTAALAWAREPAQAPYLSRAVVGLVAGAGANHAAALEQALQTFPDLREQLRGEFWHVLEAPPAVQLACLPHLDGRPQRHLLERWLATELPGDPAASLAVVRPYLEDEHYAECVADAWSAWRRSDRKAADRWLETAEPSVRARVDAQLNERTALQNPAAYLAAQSAAASGAVAECSRRVTYALRELLELSPAEAVAHLRAQPAWRTPGNCVAAVSALARTDEAAAVAFLDLCPDVATRDQALAELGEHWAASNEPALAAEAVASVADADRQIALRFDVYRRLAARDEAAAEQWLAAQGVDESVRRTWRALHRAQPSATVRFGCM